jgi:hypothetical protein
MVGEYRGNRQSTRFRALPNNARRAGAYDYLRSAVFWARDLGLMVVSFAGGWRRCATWHADGVSAGRYWIW